MTALGDAVFDILKAIATVGGPAAPRVYRGSLPTPYTLPALVYLRVDGGFEYAHDGDSDLIHPRYQVSCYAATGVAAESLALGVQQAMDAWAGGTALPADQRDLSDPETSVHHVETEFVLWWSVT